MIAAIFAILVSFTLHACSNANHFGITGQSRKGGEDSEAKGNDKFSDGSEGVPGYLVDPRNKIDLSKDSDKVEIKGQSGAVATQKGKITDVIVGIFTMKRSEFFTPDQSSDGSVFYEPKLAEVLSPAKDGTFQASATVAEDSILIIAVVKDSADQTIYVQRKDPKFPRSAFADLATSLDVQILDEEADVPPIPGSSPLFALCSQKTSTGTPWAERDDVYYYMGGYDQSCIDVCSARAGVRNETRTVIGSGDPGGAVCVAVVNSMCPTASVQGMSTDQPPGDMGCVTRPLASVNDMTTAHNYGYPTNFETRSSAVSRICACNADPE